MKLSKIGLALSVALLATGCATKGPTASAMQDEIGASQATAQIAVEAANVANEQARKALAMAEKALAEAEKANACCEANKTEFADKLDRMFKKSMYK